MYEDRLVFVEHKGKRVFYCNFSDLTMDKAIEMLDELDVMIKKEPLGSVLMLGNYKNLHFSISALSAFNKKTPEHQKYLKAGSIIGVEGLIKIMFDAASKFIKVPYKVCKTYEEAMDWLATH